MLKPMRVQRFLMALLCAALAACAAQAPSVQYRPASGEEFARDRDACMQKAQFNSSGNPITFGGGYGGNAFYSSGPYLDCMVARGYSPDAIGEVLGTPSREKSIGGY